MIWNKLKIAFKIKALVLTMVVLVFALLSYTAYLIFYKALLSEATKEVTLLNQYKEEQLFELNLRAEAFVKDAALPIEQYLQAESSNVDPSLNELYNQLKSMEGGAQIAGIYISNSAMQGGDLSLTPENLGIQNLDEFLGNSSYKLGQIQYVEDRLLMPAVLRMSSGEIVLLTINHTPTLNYWLKKGKESNAAVTQFFLLRSKDTLTLVSLEGSKIITTADSDKFPFLVGVFEGTSGSGEWKTEESGYLTAWLQVQSIQGGFISSIATRDVLAPLNSLIKLFLGVGAVVLLVSFLITAIFSNVLIQPLNDLKGKLSLIGQGILPENLEINSEDEVGEMTVKVNSLVDGLKRTAVFANKIGKGNFDAEFKPLSEQDTLGKALIEMRDSLQESEKRDNERNWIVSGIAEIGQILRSHSSLDLLGDEVVSYMCNRIRAVQGAIYLAEEEDGKQQLHLNACYAYNRKKHHKQFLKLGEGLAGQAAIEKATIYRVEIPHNYVTITSGLIDEQRPNNILIVPLISNEEVFGVLEFAAFEKLNPREIRFVEETAEIIARTIFNITVNDRTRKLLEESQKLAKDLQARQEDLRRNAEEMERTQEELRNSNVKLEDQIEEVNRTQKRMQVLLENASEVITIYEENSTIRYISPSVESILGYSPEELIGTSDIQHYHELGAQDFKAMFNKLLTQPEEQVTIQFSYTRKNGEQVWLEATGKNMLSDRAIQGIVVNTRNITERRRAEKEARMRGQMQALSENSPDIIARLSKNKEFFYINPVIETYTGFEPEHFLQRSLKDLSLENGLVDAWGGIIDQVVDRDDKLTTEIDFPSELGKRVFNVNAIPEYGDRENLESVLLVLHDITSRKIIELDVQNKNKKITESINYAKRIQGAILPDNKSIKRVLKDSFIYYKPKDVVSGDFPWFMQKGDDLYIAAVDCTGHGVPGALISLIGYFLLNDIVGGEKMKDPGGILTLLDEKVTKTLKQDTEDSQTRDGMDVAFCKINLKKKKLEYAGAHRPLYMLKNGELQEFKGDKFPIGGAQYKTRTAFTNYEIDIEEGDRIFFCSDGFPDQFNAENKKFSPKRIRELIQQHHDIPVYEMHEVMANEFETWKGNTRQLDDVLMIGIGF